MNLIFSILKNFNWILNLFIEWAVEIWLNYSKISSEKIFGYWLLKSTWIWGDEINKGKRIKLMELRRLSRIK